MSFSAQLLYRKEGIFNLHQPNSSQPVLKRQPQGLRLLGQAAQHSQQVVRSSTAYARPSVLVVEERHRIVAEA